MCGSVRDRDLRKSRVRALCPDLALPPFFRLQNSLLLKTNVSKFHPLLSAHPLPLALGLKSFQVVQRKFSLVVITKLSGLRKQSQRHPQ